MKNGFTLTELLAVIVILSILMLIAIPAYNDVAEDVKRVNLESMKTTLVNTVLDYANKNLIDDIKPSNNDCSSGNCCKYYSIEYIKNNNIFQTSDKEKSFINPVTNQELEGYVKLTYDTTNYALVGEYTENADNKKCEVLDE
jgi:prepilin-type N-terminal cleavage/methylation domain-containing protein